MEFFPLHCVKTTCFKKNELSISVALDLVEMNDLSIDAPLKKVKLEKEDNQETQCETSDNVTAPSLERIGDKGVEQENIKQEMEIKDELLLKEDLWKDNKDSECDPFLNVTVNPSEEDEDNDEDEEDPLASDAAFGGRWRKLRASCSVPSSEKLFECDECKKRFQHFQTLSIHIRTHTEATQSKWFRCDFCNKRFMCVHTFKRHKRVHTGEKLYSCGLCQKTLDSLSALKNHAQNHTREKMYACGYCDRKFFSSLNMKDHERTHN